jgi:hypothetical protein
MVSTDDLKMMMEQLNGRLVGDADLASFSRPSVAKFSAA